MEGPETGSLEEPETGSREGFALLGRRKGGALEVLALEAEAGKVLCLFETQQLADAFARVSPEVRGGGWSVHVMTVERLPELAEEFDYVTIDPSPRADVKMELVPAVGFARSLKSRRADPEQGG